MKTFILAVVVLFVGCGPELNRNAVACTGVRPMKCDCVVSCITTSEQVLVTVDEPASCEATCYNR